MSPNFNTIAIIGIGLIGSSLTHAIRRNNLSENIIIHDSNPNHLKEAKNLNLGTDYETDITKAVKTADMVIICTPVGSMKDIAKTIAPHLKKGAIITDVGSVKKTVIADIAPHLPSNVNFIPAHPIAGTEKSGPSAGFPTLFDGRWTILTPIEGTDKTQIKKLTKFWQSCGAKTETMTPNHHDKVLAITSHLPHLIAYTIVGTATELETDLKQEVIEYSASGFRDFTRIAASDPIMWRDICLNNKEGILEILQRFTEDLTALQRAIRRDEGDRLEEYFTHTRSIRRAVIDAHQEIPPSKKT